MAGISETAAHKAKISSISIPWVERDYMCNFGQLPSFMHKYGNFENRPISWKLVPVEQKLAQFRPPGVERQLFQILYQTAILSEN